MCEYIKDGGLIKSRERGENIGRDEKRIAGSLETRTFYRCYRFLDPSNMASTWKTLFNSLRDEICFAADCSTKYYLLRNVAIKWCYTSTKLYDYLCLSIFSKRCFSSFHYTGNKMQMKMNEYCDIKRKYYC